jgi:hypothetical protein
LQEGERRLIELAISSFIADNEENHKLLSRHEVGKPSVNPGYISVIIFIQI